ncbi:hypothetical protein DPSP01_005487 [Paraphaeosphaeria sporulosa]
MALGGRQKRTFLPYETAVLPEDLRLGSLYLNPLEPVNGLARDRFEYRRDLVEQSDYETHISNFTRKAKAVKGYSHGFQRSHMNSAGLSFTSFLGLGSKRENSVHITLTGTSGRRVQIRDPEVFLEEVLKQTGVDEWLRMHATPKYKSRYSASTWTAPELWLVTGLQYVTGGEYHFEDNAAKELLAHGGLDVGAAAGGPAGVAKLKAEARHERANGAQNGGVQEDECVWAAQFMPVMIEFGPQAPDAKLTKRGWFPKTIKTIYLEDVKDLEFQGVRAGDKPVGEETPELVARITTAAEARDHDASEEKDSESEGSEEFVIDDGPYVQSLQNANFEMHNKYTNYLAKKAGQRTQRIAN